MQEPEQETLTQAASIEETRGHDIFVTGSTGYIGSRLIKRLLSQGHYVRALTRLASMQKLPVGCEPVVGDALIEDYGEHVSPADTFVHLVGVAHPSPAKAEQFRSVDLCSLKLAVAVARKSAIQHFVYVSVAHPAPAMKAYVAVRQECEQIIRDSGLSATILRPWYVLGPGHRWPYALVPFYWIMERIPATREGARRLGLVTLDQMLHALVSAVEHPASGIQIADVPQIRARVLAA